MELTSIEERDLEKKMVWLTGSGRSGSTWLGTQLLNHPENLIWDEPYIGNHFASVSDWQTNRGDPYFLSKKYQDVWKYHLRKLILNRAHAQFSTTAKNIIIKDPNAGFGAPAVVGALPDSKMIFLIRDGRDVVDSQINATNKGSWNENGVIWATDKGRNERIKKFAKNWANSLKHVSFAFENHSPENRLLVKYEDLRTDTLAQTKRVYSFLDVSITDEDLASKVDKYAFENIDEDLRGDGKFYRSAKVGGWKEAFSGEEHDTIMGISEPILRKFGYV